MSGGMPTTRANALSRRTSRLQTDGDARTTDGSTRSPVGDWSWVLPEALPLPGLLCCRWPPKPDEIYGRCARRAPAKASSWLGLFLDLDIRNPALRSAAPATRRLATAQRMVDVSVGATFSALVPLLPVRPKPPQPGVGAAR
jgi:hypothetical protein